MFDLGGVVINLDRKKCMDSFRQLGLDNLEELIGTSAQKGLFLQLEKGMISASEFRHGLREMAGKALTDKQIDAAWNSMLVDIPRYKLDALLALRERYMVYLLSNTNVIHWDWMCANAFSYKGFGVRNYFEEVYLSFKMKLVKPDTKIFEALLEQSGIIPKETLFLDDSKANCEAAAALGISTYLCKPGENWTFLFEKKQPGLPL